MKKLFLLLAVIAVIAMVFTGCKKTTEQGTSGESTKPNVITNDTTVANLAKEPETDPYVANIPVEIIDIYKEKVEAINKAYKENQAKLLETISDTDITSLGNVQYDLVFFNDDNIPELVVTYPENSMALYTYDAGQVIYTMKDDEIYLDDERGLGYGVGGNGGYDYIPRANVMRNFNTEVAGMYRYITYREIDPNTHLIVNKYEGSLKEKHFEGDDPFVEDGYVEEPTAYYIGDKEITSGEFAEKLIDGDFEELTGTKSYTKMIEALDGMLNIK